MTKSELIDDIARRAGVDRAIVKACLEAFVASVVAALRRGEEVRLLGFGSFTPIARAAGLTRNPRTGKQMKREASKTARFRVGDSLKSALN